MSLNVILTVSLLVLGYFMLAELIVITLWGLAKVKKQALAKGLVITAFVAALPVYFCLFQLLGLMVNFTPSLPVGIYRQANSQEIRCGDIVSYCLDVPGYVALAKERGYLGAGTCDSGLKPLLKHVAGLPGDVVGKTADGQLTVNQMLLAGVYIASADSENRAMPESILLPGIISEGKTLLVSYHLGGFDGRYFGLVNIDKLKKYKPLITF